MIRDSSTSTWLPVADTVTSQTQLDIKKSKLRKFDVERCKMFIGFRHQSYLAPVSQITLGENVQVRQLELHHRAEAQKRSAHELGRVRDECSVQQEYRANIVIP